MTKVDLNEELQVKVGHTSKVGHPIFSPLKKLNKAIVTLEKTILMVLITEMVILAALQILSRFLIKKPISWSEELLTYSFMWLSFIGASYALAAKKHFEVDLLTSKFNPKVRKGVSLGIKSIILIFTFLMVKNGYAFAQINQFQSMSVLPFTMFWPTMVLPISGGFMFLHTVIDILEILKGGEL